MRVVVVEDEVKTKTGLTMLIERQTGHNVVSTAKNGLEGLEICRRFKPDLIFTDIRMPEMDGITMLTCLQKEGLIRKAVILTGYAEFEYAQKAITLGVKDYLLKPLAVEDVVKLMAEIQQELVQEEKDSLSRSNQLLRELAISGLSSEKLLETQEVCQLQDEPVLAFLCYCGGAEAGYPEYFSTRLDIIKRMTAPAKWTCIPLDGNRDILVLCRNFTVERAQELQAEFSSKAVESCPANLAGAVWSSGLLMGIAGLKNTIDFLRESLRWNICLGSGSLIYENDQRKLEPFIYPEQTEQQIKNSVINNERDQIIKDMEQFQNQVIREYHEPDEVINAYVRLISAILNALKSLDARAYQQILNQKLLNRIMTAITSDELQLAVRDVVSVLTTVQDKKEDIRNYTVRKVINFIRQHFSENITLEHIADQFDITPEYLSTLFNKEMGITFTSFLKEFRISYAKRLLLGSDLKIYEVASNVGYADPKYFNRVFKEVTGLSPGDFRGSV